MKRRILSLALTLALTLSLVPALSPTATASTVSVSNENQLRAAVAQAGSTPTTITLTADIQLVSNFVIPSGADITLTSSGGTMFSLIATRDMDTITIESRAALTIENIGVTRISGTYGSGVYNSGTFTMNSGSISGNASTRIGGGGVLMMMGNGIFFTMNGGDISNNTSSENGGGVYFSRGTFIMNGGKISRNTAERWGGGVAGDGAFTMNGGEISENIANGGVNIYSSRSGGGGGVYASGGSFVVNNGTISNNSAINGGGMSVSFTSIDTFTMNGGTVRNNTASRNGGGVYTEGSGGMVTMNGGAIHGNTANENGGGVSIGSVLNGTFTMTGGEIYSNTAVGNGGGASNNGGTFTVDGGWIYNNRAASGADIHLDGGTFNNNVFNANLGAIGSPPFAAEWARPGIAAALEKGFVPADIQDSYTATITRQEFARMAVEWVKYALGETDLDAIVAAHGLPERAGLMFGDTSDANILAAYRLGITAGEVAPTADAPGQFNPNGDFTRQEAATMIMNTCRAIGADVSNPPTADFADLSATVGWAQPGINFVRANGIMSGSGGNFMPLGTFTRQESIVTFNNIDLP
ncbi:MAG: S-layer homology domain-containing protein [Oscillospiraceae bacterium]|nr:S-layer homology domain-containing protein [Oscillospiraceae bacterium]